MVIRLALLLIAAAWHSSAAGGASRSGACTEGIAEPAAAAILRPEQTVQCPYDLNEVRRRILRLLAVEEGALRVEHVERLFGLPSLYRLFDDPRSAWYGVSLTGGGGPGGWKARLDFRENFRPGRPRFRGGKRPVRIHKRQRGEIYFSITFDGLDYATGGARCWPAAQLVNAALKLGWQDLTGDQTPPTHPGVPRTMQMERGILTLFPGATWADLEGSCAREVSMMQKGNSPAVP